jgi:cytoskeletal protein CcmA (bactofilin family)
MYRLWVITLILFATPALVAAETVVRSSTTVAVGETDRVENDFYAGGLTVTQNGTVVGDMYAAAQQIEHAGTVEADFTALAGLVTVAGPVNDDVRLVVGEATIDSEVGGDVFFTGGTLTVTASTTIGGNLYIFGGLATVDGTVDGIIKGQMEQLTLAGQAGGIDVTARQRLTLSPTAVVTGDVRYESNQPIVRAPAAEVLGTVEASVTERETPAQNWSAYLIPFLIMLFGSLSLYLLGRPLLVATVERTLNQPFQVSLVGVAVALLGPFVAILLMTSALGFVVGLGAFGILLTLVALSFSVAPMILGVLLWRLFGGSLELQPFAILLGALMLQLAFLVPLVGALLLVSLSVLAIGALLLVCISRLRTAG